MSEDAHLTPEPYDPRKFVWACPHCPYVFNGYSQEGANRFRELHLGFHKREEYLAERGIPSSFYSNAKTPIDPGGLLIKDAPRLLPAPPLKTPEEYEKLELTVADKAFLKTRGIDIREWEK